MALPTSLIPCHDDLALMRRVQRGDATAFAALHDRLRPRALRVASSICASRHDAEEAMQEGFLSVWRGRERYDPRSGTVAVWVLALVRNRAIDMVRRRTPQPWEMREEETAAPGDLHEAATQRDDAAELRAVLARLPAAQRRVIEMAYFDELTHPEIAQALGIPMGTVKGRLRLGLHRARRGYGRYEVPAAAAGGEPR